MGQLSTAVTVGYGPILLRISRSNACASVASSKIEAIWGDLVPHLSDQENCLALPSRFGAAGPLDLTVLLMLIATGLEQTRKLDATD